MAHPSRELVRALRDTARRLQKDAPFHWGHMGRCNCGHLAHTVTGATPAEIHAAALERHGDWAGQALEYCPTSGLEIDALVGRLLDLGLTGRDLAQLERLNDPQVLRRIPADRLPLQRSRRDDAVLYMHTWADALAERVPIVPPAKNGPQAASTELPLHAGSEL